MTAAIVATVAPHACVMCGGPLAWDGPEGPHDAWRCAACGWDHISTGCCDGAVEDLLPETGPMPPRRVLMRDPTLPHQIRLDYSSRLGEGIHSVVVGCNCGGLRKPVVTAEYALALYRDHLTREGVDPDD